jgi:hypothetical protein
VKNLFPGARSTDLMNKDLIGMLRGDRAPNAKYAVIDALRRETHTAAPTAKLTPLPKHDLPSISSPKLRKIFG